MSIALLQKLQAGVQRASYKMGTGSLSRGSVGGGVALTTHCSLAPRLKKE
jgi:hypothetical protein